MVAVSFNGVRRSVKPKAQKNPSEELPRGFVCGIRVISFRKANKREGATHELPLTRD